MTRACIATVRDATGNIFSDEEIDDIINRVADRAVRARRATPDLSEQAAIHQAMREVTAAELRAQLLDRRREQLWITRRSGSIRAGWTRSACRRRGTEASMA